MSDRSNGSIRIGGTVSDLESLLDAIEAQGAGPDWGVIFNDRAAIVAHLQGAGEDGALFARHELIGGLMEELEAECRAQGLRYVAQWDGYPGGWEDGGRMFDGEHAHDYLGGDAAAITRHEIEAGGFQTVAQIVAHLKEIDEFKPGPVVIPPEVLAAWEDAQ